MIERRPTIAVGVATVAFGAALALRERLDPWLVTGAAAAIGGLIAIWALGARRLRALFAVNLRGIAVAAALGVALVIATHAVFRVVAPLVGSHVRGLYVSIDTVVPREIQATIALAVVIVEELVWRGCAFALAGHRRMPVIAVGLYALPQLAGGEWMLVAAALGLGAVLAVQRMRTGRLLEPLVTHAIWSLAIFVVVPLVPV